MKKKAFITLLITVSLLFFACSTMDDVVKGIETADKIKSSVPSGSSSAMAAATSAGAIDFRSGEVLSSAYNKDNVFDDQFRAAKILTPPSDATKGQAEVLFGNGDRKWVIRVIASHRAGKQEMGLGKPVLYMYYNSTYESINADDYRNGSWRFGRITSTDELFKDMVEVDGKPCYVKWLRMSDQPVE